MGNTKNHLQKSLLDDMILKFISATSLQFRLSTGVDAELDIKKVLPLARLFLIIIMDQHF